MVGGLLHDIVLIVRKYNIIADIEKRLRRASTFASGIWTQPVNIVSGGHAITSMPPRQAYSSYIG